MDEVEMVERLTKVEERSKSNTHQIEELKPVINEIHQMSKTMVELVGVTKRTNEDVSLLNEKVEKIEQAPAESWNSTRKQVINTILSTVASAIVGAVAAGMLVLIKLGTGI